MSTFITCETALQLAGQTKISGEVLAARWHVRNCDKCQQMLNTLATDIAVFEERLVLQKLLNIDLGEALCQQGERVITWLERSTRKVLVSLVRLSDVPLSYAPMPQLTTLGAGGKPADQIIKQAEERTPDGLLKWKITFIVDSTDPEHCQAEVDVSTFDRWEQSGIDVLLTWETEHRRAQTDEHGLVQFYGIPINVLGRINVVIHPPTRTNAPQ